MRRGPARSPPADAARNGGKRSLAVLLVALPWLAVPLSVIAYHGLAPFAVLLALLGLAVLLDRRGSVWPPLVPLLPFAGLLAWGALSAFWSLDPEVSLQRWLKLVGHFLLGAVLLAAVSQGLAPKAARAWATRVALWGGAGALAVLAAHALSGGAFLIALGLTTPHPDAASVLPATNPAATVIAVFCGPVGLLVYRRYGAVTAIAAFTLTAVVVATFSQSLAAKVALAAALAVGGLVLWRSRAALRGLAVAVVTLVFLLPALRLVDPAPFSLLRTAAASQGVTLPGSVIQRTYMYDFVLARIAERPLLGWGLETSSVLPGGQERVPHPTLDDHEFLTSHPHNGVLEVWVELGPVGALGYAAVLWLVVGAIRRHAADRATAAALAAAATGYVVVGLFAYSIWSSWWIATGILATATAIGMLHSPASACGPQREKQRPDDETDRGRDAGRPHTGSP